MQEIRDTILAAESADDLRAVAGLPIPESYRGVVRR
ncbi:MAG: hypothetical protein QOC93_507, partial [Actinomycetota bacterium]|nr:hypothetical protein [Actinomycetota bacterium]